MATAEPAPSSLGPRYAPDDPTLPKPWKGLIDGSTGVLYYWNPETNVTQYEKPPTLPPPLPPGPPPAVSTPKLAPIPVAQHGQQIAQTSQQQQAQQVSQHGHLIPQQQSPLVAPVTHQQGSHMPHAGQQQNPQLAQAMQQQHGQVALTQQQLMQHPGQQMPHMIQQLPQQSGQHALQQPGQQLPQQAIHQMPHQIGQQAPQSQGAQMTQPQAQQFTHQQLQYMAYQLSMLPQGQQSSQQQTQHSAQGQTFANQQEYKSAFPKREEDDFQNRNQIGFSPSHFQQAGVSAVQNLAAGTNSAQMSQISVHSGQTQQFGGPLRNMQQPSSMGQMQPTGSDLHHPQGPRFQNERDLSAMHNQQSNMPPVGLRIGQDNNLHNRSGNEYYQQPKLAAIPMARSQQVNSKI